MTAGHERVVLADDGGLVVEVVPFGARLHALRVPGDSGPVDLVVGPDDPAAHAANRFYTGATIGRVANRVRDARAVVDGVEHSLTANAGPHTLHGGEAGAFDRVVWEVLDRTAASVLLGHTSPDGSEGFPGRVEARVEYALTDVGLAITMSATTDAATPVSMTNHAYWNLRGDGGSVLDHELTLLADELVETDDDLVPTGEVRDVSGTPYDLRRDAPLRDHVRRLAATGADGFDDPFLLRGPSDGPREVATLHDPVSGRRLVLSSDQPCLQLYSCNDPGLPWRDGRRLPEHAAVALEPQAVPDAVNLPAFPSPVLQPGERYLHRLLVRVDAP